MPTAKYEPETLHEDSDDGTMPESLDALAQAVVGHRITAVDNKRYGHTLLTLDNGKQVRMRHSSDCYASTEVESFLLHPERVDHIITGVGTTDGYTVWHIYADMGDVLELQVGWSCGNPFYYGYGFGITVEEIIHADSSEGPLLHVGELDSVLLVPVRKTGLRVVQVGVPRARQIDSLR